MNQYEISVQEFEDNMEFCVDLCARERIVWKIRRDNGEYIMCVPVTERAAPVEPDILSMVNEFKESFMEKNAT